MDAFVRCLRGIEWIATAELVGRLGAEVETVRHREIRFTIDAVAGGVDDADLLDLRTVDDVFATVVVADGFGRTRAELGRMTSAVAASEVERDGWAEVGAGDGAGSERPPSSRATPTVEVVGSFLGRRNFSRFELEDAVGPGLAGAVAGRYVSRASGQPVEADITFRAHLDGEQLVVGRRLGRRPLHRRAYKATSGAASLHPPLAAAMVLLAGIDAGARLLDPFCGSGTIVAEARRWSSSMTAVGADRSEAALAHAAGNVAAATGVDAVRNGPPALVRADAADEPWRPGRFDRLVTNPPWGAQAPFAGRADGTTVIGLVAEQLAAGGRAAVLVDEDVDGHVRWADEPRLTTVVSLFGRHPRLHLFHDGPDPIPPGGRWSAQLAAALP